MSSRDAAKRIRKSMLEMVHRAKASHVGSALSIADILAVLYCDVLRFDAAKPQAPDRDRFILSKGHACVALYAMLADAGFFAPELLRSYGVDFSPLMSHASHHVPGVELSTGSLGHGLPFGVGKALAARIAEREHRVFVLLSDGELDEGSNWEAFLFAAHHRLERLCVIVDYNKLQSLDSVDKTIGLEPLADKLRAFGWAVQEADGHSHDALREALDGAPCGKPRAIIAHTVKGKGVSFMEHQVLWHYRNPDDAQLERALAELERGDSDA